MILEAVRYVDLVVPEYNWKKNDTMLLNIRRMFLLWKMIGRVSLIF